VPGSAEGSFPGVTKDIEGQSRDGSPDAGADEVTTGTATNRPLTANDVGPAWFHGTAATELRQSWIVQ
jgi:hypothetical protein